MELEKTKKKPVWPLGILVLLAVGLIALRPSAVLGPWTTAHTWYVIINGAVFVALLFGVHRARRA